MCNVTIEGLSKNFGDTEVLNDLNFKVNAGEFLVVIGSSGCGKSTLIRLIAGLEQQSNGNIFFDSTLVNKVSPADRNVAMVFQDYALYPHMTVKENISFALKFSKLKNREINNIINELAKTLSIADLLDRWPASLSGGQKQRVAIGRALARNPKVFLCDEPLSNLDAGLRSKMRFEISRIFKELGNSAMIYVTHDQTEALTMGRKIILLNSGIERTQNGSIAQYGTPDELYNNPQNLYVASFLGSPSMNFIDGKIIKLDKDKVLVALDNNEQLMVNVCDTGLKLDSKVILGFRPEDAVTGIEKNENRFKNEIIWKENLGDVFHLHLKQPDSRPMIIKLHKTKIDHIATDSTIVYNVPPDNIFMFSGANNKAVTLSSARLNKLIENSNIFNSQIR